MGSKLPVGLAERVTAEIEISEPRLPVGLRSFSQIPAGFGRAAVVSRAFGRPSQSFLKDFDSPPEDFDSRPERP